MRHALSKDSWKSLLPDVYDWLEKISVASGTATVQGAHHVVAVKQQDDQADSFALNAPKLPDALQKKLTEQAKALGWRPSAGPLHLVADGTSVTLVPQTATRVGPVQAARQLGLDAARATKELKITHLAMVEANDLAGLDVFDGYANGLYNHLGFKGTRKKDPSRFPTQVTLAGCDADIDRIKDQVQLSCAQILTRFLQDAPANYMDPLKLAEIAKDVAQDLGVTCKILDKEQMAALGMGSFLSVADGGGSEPRTIVFEIDGQDNSRCIALVGKGLTFDSGGISIKPAAGMDEMKYDMSGGAAVLGAARFLGKVKPPVKTICVIGATENMPSGSATKPGDVVRAMNGKTIEVLNTDAEGRLVLADCLHYAVSTYKPEMVIDIATLTGAVLMALGTVGAGVMSNHQETASYVMKSGEAVGEPMWQLPLWPEFDKEVKGEVADLKNIAKPNVKAGTIMGAAFLKEFVGDAKWVHLDIAGTGWNTMATGYPTSGGSAFGLRTMAKAVLNFNR